jgi:cytidylate kinase
LIEETLSNRNWVLRQLAADAEMSVERINELLERDRASDVELQKLAQRLVKPDGEAWEEGELVDIRLAEDLKRRQRQKRSQK